MSQPQVLIGNESSDHLKIKVLHRNYPHTDDFWDGNWCCSEISLQVGGFQGKYETDLRTTDFQDFLTALAHLDRTLKGEAVFDTMEGQLIIKMTGNGKGQISVQGLALDQPGRGNKLEFSFELDQTFLSPICSELEKIVQVFPVVGTP